LPAVAGGRDHGHGARSRACSVWTARTLPPFEGFGPWDPATFALAARQGRRTYSTIEVGDETMRVLSLPLRGKNGQIEAVLQAARPLADLNFAIGRLTRTLLTFVPIALLIAAAGGAFLTDRILRPVRHITQAASRIGAEDLSQRLPVAGGDEFAKLAATFNGLLGRLESAFEQQRRFTADASHELRTPLAAIKVHTSLALMGERTPAQYKQTLRTVDRSADTATRIVQDLLLLARSDTGRFDLRVAPTPLSDVLLRAVETVEATAHDPDRPPPARITLDLHDPTLAVAGDAHHLSRLFTNLLDNALRHTPSDGSVRIIARAEDANTVVVDVEDTGEGIAPEHLPHVTERFYRVDAARARAHGGTGLGLSICKSIAEAHGGGLVVESEVGRGTRVRVTLPRATCLARAARSGKHRQSPDSSSGWAGTSQKRRERPRDGFGPFRPFRTGGPRLLTTPDKKMLLAPQPGVRFVAASSGDKANAPATVVAVDDERADQPMDGFGAALTDSSAWLISRLPPDARDALLRDLFDPKQGIGLSVIRTADGRVRLFHARQLFLPRSPTRRERPESVALFHRARPQIHRALAAPHPANQPRRETHRLAVDGPGVDEDEPPPAWRLAPLARVWGLCPLLRSVLGSVPRRGRARLGRDCAERTASRDQVVPVHAHGAARPGTFRARPPWPRA
jgi:heavy metal sensor kinase